MTSFAKSDMIDGDVAETFADCVILLQIFGTGVEDTHLTLPVKKASQRTDKKKKKEEEDEEREGEERRSSSVYDSRSSLRR